MPNLRDIEKRINSVHSTKQITRTMEMVATAKIRKASDRVIAATPYSEAMNETLGRLAAESKGADHPLLAEHVEKKKALIIAVVSDRGLAGAFNSSVLRTADKLIAAYKLDGVETELIACGKRASAYFKYRKYPVAKEYLGLSADPTLEQAREIASYAIELYTGEKIDEVHLIYNHAKNVADQLLRSVAILPVQTDAFAAAGAADGAAGVAGATDAAGAASTAKADENSSAEKTSAETGAGYEFEPDNETVLAHLLPAYVETEIYHALVDSAAAEQGARRKAMKSATDNAADMIETLTRLYNRVRQSAITTEISEIVGGAAAIEETK